MAASQARLYERLAVPVLYSTAAFRAPAGTIEANRRGHVTREQRAWVEAPLRAQVRSVQNDVGCMRISLALFGVMASLLLLAIWGGWRSAATS